MIICHVVVQDQKECFMVGAAKLVAIFLQPNARACATTMGEGPEAEGLKHFVFTFYTFDGIKNSMGVYGKDERDAKIRLREYCGKICKIKLIGDKDL